MGLKWCPSKKESNCPCKDYNEYEIKLKCMKTTLHRNYIVCISVGILVWMLATGQANSAEFSSWISFASTITSIILSVIAIFMSISGENKTDAMRNKMEETANKLEKATTIMENANDQNVENIKELKENISILERKLEQLQGQTEAVYNEYIKTNRSNNSDNMQNDISQNRKWVRSDDE